MENTNKMKWYHHLGYALGEMSYTIENTFIASYMVLYFTTTIGIPALTIGTLTLVCRIIDAFTDLGFGMLADRTKKNKMGKFKPWYVGSLILTAISFFLYLRFREESEQEALQPSFGHISCTSCSVLSLQRSTISGYPLRQLSAQMIRRKRER